MNHLPLDILRVGVPPIKCQGIKTKLVPFILRSIRWSSIDDTRWIEPFLGSGVVAFNLAPMNAILADINPHIIRFYTAIQRGEMTGTNIRTFLEQEGAQLARKGSDYYYTVRRRFNSDGSPFDFLFLNRSCFNGVMRFNQQGGFNVPFGHKPQRFSPAYITKIVNQVQWVARQMHGKDWEFRVARWEETLNHAVAGDFVYLDPPYVGRHTDYYNTWNVSQAERLALITKRLICGFALSMWSANRYRVNTHIDECWTGTEVRICRHFYYVGASEDNRNAMDEALLIKPGYATPDNGTQQTHKDKVDLQLELPLLSSSG